MVDVERRLDAAERTADGRDAHDEQDDEDEQERGPGDERAFEPRGLRRHVFIRVVLRPFGPHPVRFRRLFALVLPHAERERADERDDRAHDDGQGRAHIFRGDVLRH